MEWFYTRARGRPLDRARVADLGPTRTPPRPCPVSPLSRPRAGGGRGVSESLKINRARSERARK